MKEKVEGRLWQSVAGKIAAILYPLGGRRKI
jgi:hypothetical protein